MKNILLLLIILSISLGAKSQNSTVIKMTSAKELLNKNNPSYNPKNAFSIFLTCAKEGNFEAMNAVGVLYSSGNGTTMDHSEAISWLKKAAKGNYGPAIVNLGLVYKNALDTDQDFEKAFEYFKKSSDLNFPLGIYYTGYMLYKGFGCNQSYNEAFKLFNKGAKLRQSNSMYMLGLCYRNGYGVTFNIDSARFWLQRSSLLGDKFAAEELLLPNPENINLKDLDILKANPSLTTPELKQIAAGQGYQIIKKNYLEKDINGEYIGYVIKFDWSGKYIIGESGLKLNLIKKGPSINGIWQEDGISTQVNAQIVDSAIIFKNTHYSLSDHYNVKVPNDIEFKNARLKFVKGGDSLLLSGVVQLYSTKLREPEKPTFIMLVRTSNKETIESISSSNDAITNMQFSTKADSLHFIAFPNPFVNSLRISFTLNQDYYVKTIISNLQTSTIVSNSPAELLKAGEHSTEVYINAPSGVYVVTLVYGNKLKSAIVFKN